MPGVVELNVQDAGAVPPLTRVTFGVHVTWSPDGAGAVRVTLLLKVPILTRVRLVEPELPLLKDTVVGFAAMVKS